MKESLAKTDKKLIFKETFADEASVRANGGVPTNVTFNKGKGIFNLGYIKYNLSYCCNPSFACLKTPGCVFNFLIKNFLKIIKWESLFI
jgi:hypothetical protein